MPHPLAAYPPLSVVGRGEARRFLPEAAELLHRGIPERLSLDPSPLSFLPLPGGATQVSSVTVKECLDTDTHIHTQPSICTVGARARARTCTRTYTHSFLYAHTHSHTHADEAAQNEGERCSAHSGSFRKLSFVAYHVPCPVYLDQQGVWCNGQMNRQMTKLTGVYAVFEFYVV
jgi:hypothetical protein